MWKIWTPPFLENLENSKSHLYKEVGVQLCYYTSRIIFVTNFNSVKPQTIYTGLLKCKLFPNGGTKGGILPTTQEIDLSLHVPPLFWPKNVYFVIFMQFLVIFPIMPYKLLYSFVSVIKCLTTSILIPNVGSV